MSRTQPIQGCLRVASPAAELGLLIASLLDDGLEPVLDRPVEGLDSGVDRPEVLVIELHDVASTVHDLPPFRVVAEYSPG